MRTMCADGMKCPEPDNQEPNINRWREKEDGYPDGIRLRCGLLLSGHRNRRQSPCDLLFSCSRDPEMQSHSRFCQPQRAHVDACWCALQDKSVRVLRGTFILCRYHQHKRRARSVHFRDGQHRRDAVRVIRERVFSRRNNCIFPTHFMRELKVAA